LKEKHREAYEKVYQKLKSTQLVWCFTNCNEAVCYASIEEFEKTQDRILWEIDVPDKEIKCYCPVAWKKLRTGKLKMYGFVSKIYEEPLLVGEILAKSKFKEDFNKYWSKKTKDELLDLMFLEKKPVFDFSSSNSFTWVCSESVIVIHPVGKENIKKNPLLDDDKDWWRTLNTYNKTPQPPSLYINKKYLQKIPCENCPGRRSSQNINISQVWKPTIYFS
jgi:hypothetical protein